MSDDMQTVSIDFDSTPFEVHDYFYVLSGLRERGLLLHGFRPAVLGEETGREDASGMR